MTFDDALRAVQVFTGRVVHVAVDGRAGGLLARLRGRQEEAQPYDDGVEPERWLVSVKPVEEDEGPTITSGAFFGYILDSATFEDLRWSTIGPEALTLVFVDGEIDISLDDSGSTAPDGD